MYRNFSGDDISVIIPTYNSDQTIAPLLESILKQKPLPGEIIVIDDKSRDETINIVKRYPVRLIQQEKNGGPAKVRNRGIKEASGEIILFIDSDTYLMTNAVQEILSRFNNNENVYAQNGWCDFNPLNKGWFPLYKGLVENSWGDALADWDDSSKCINARIGAFIKTSLIEMGGFNENYTGVTVEDHEFGIRYTKKHKIFFNKKLIVRHHFPTFFQTIKKYWKRTYEIMELIKKYKNVMDKGGVSKGSAIQYIIGAALIVLPFISIFIPILWVLWFLMIVVFIFLSKDALKKSFGNGIFFGLYGSFVHAFLGLVIIGAVSFFYLNSFGEKNSKRNKE